jgi:hypothetical protein
MPDLPLYITARDCFGEDFYLPLVEEVCAASSRWLMAGTGAPDSERGVRYGQGRMAWVLPEDLEPITVREVFLPYLLDVLPAACSRLGIEPIQDPDVELQITAYHNRGGYERHTDDGSSKADQPASHKRRLLTYVYYFHAEPKPFGGGTLNFPDHDCQIEPTQDMLVCFLPHQPHEVHPVYTGSKAPESCRFTINGWVSEREQSSEVPL